MALSDAQRLRLFLRDVGRDGAVFADDHIEQLLLETDSIEEAAALGWLLKAASAADTPRTVTIGQTSETLGQATESWKQAISMHQYWNRRAAEVSGSSKGVGRWLEIQPAEGMIADLQDTIAAIYSYWEENDISQLYPVV